MRKKRLEVEVVCTHMRKKRLELEVVCARMRGRRGLHWSLCTCELASAAVSLLFRCCCFTAAASLLIQAVARPSSRHSADVLCPVLGTDVTDVVVVKVQGNEGGVALENKT